MRKLKYYIFKSLLVIFFISDLTSCQQRAVFSQFEEIRNLEWSKNDTLYFSIDSGLVDVGVPYNIFIDISHNADYAYRNIWFFTFDNIVDTIFNSHSKQYMLADEYGKWYGSGFGALYQVELPYNKSVYFPLKQNYLIKIVQGMRDEPLKGIEKVGIRIERGR